MKKFLFLLLLPGLACHVAAAKLEFTQLSAEAYDKALRMDSLATMKLLEREKLTNPENLMPVVIANYLEFLNAFVDEQFDAHQRLQQNKEKRIALLGQVEENNPLKKWALASIYLQSAAARSKFDETYSAAFEFRKAYLLLEENQKIAPKNAPNTVAMGLLFTLVGSIPPQYQWVAKLASMHGDLIKGKQLLFEVLDNKEYTYGSMFRSEALFFLTFIESNLNPDKKSASMLLDRFTPEDELHPLLLYAKANMEMRLGQNEAALKTLSKKDVGGEASRLYYLEYVLGDALLRKLDFSAKSHFENFINRFNGQNYKADALRKLAWISLLQGDSVGYSEKMARLVGYSKLQVESDKQARREAEKHLKPQPDLLKARLHYDGGYYAQSAEKLRMVAGYLTRLNDEHQLEYYYRMGRVLQATNKQADAIRYYQLTMFMGRDSKTYFPANAALLAGELYEADGQFELSKQMYQRCLAFEPEEYRNGIHAKAKAGLNRLSAK